MWFIARFILIGMFTAKGQSNLSNTTIANQDAEISGERIQTAFSHSASGMNILQRAVIAQLPVQNMAEILSHVPGVYVRQRGPRNA